MGGNMYVGMNYTGGEWHTHVPDFASLNPCDESDLGMFPITAGNDIAEAVDTAQYAFESWRKESRVRRADYFDVLAQLLKRDHDKLTNAISLETGKNLNESSAEVFETLHMCQYAASSGRQPFGEVISSELDTKDAYVQRKPKGVIVVITPWNFPCAISFWCAAPALVEGNTVVFKPSEYTPMVGQMVTELYHEAGFPPGVFNLIHGLKETGKELVRDHHVKTILFTGSAAAGMDIRKHCAGTWHKTCSCEMGSKSAVIVFEDGDLDLAIDVSIASAFKLSGQRCVSSGRIIIQRSIYYEFCEKFVEIVAEKVTTGNPFTDPAPFYGPLINKFQMEKVLSYNKLVREDSDSEVVFDYGGQISKDGYFLNPFVYKTEWGHKPFLKEEVFGPHVALIPFDKISDAIHIYNDTDYGLALGVVTNDFRKHRRLRDECDTGMLYINGSSVGAESQLPFGGCKKSGNGWKSAAGTYRAVTEEIAVTVNYEEGKMQFAQGMKM